MHTKIPVTVRWSSMDTRLMGMYINIRNISQITKAQNQPTMMCTATSTPRVEINTRVSTMGTIIRANTRAITMAKV